MKQNKLNLKALKLQSFVTGNKSHGILGGGTETYETKVICPGPDETVGCPVETFYTACATDVYC